MSKHYNAFIMSTFLILLTNFSFAVQLSCKNNELLICHKTNSVKNPLVELCVSKNAVDKHLKHDDNLPKTYYKDVGNNSETDLTVLACSKPEGYSENSGNCETNDSCPLFVEKFTAYTYPQAWSVVDVNGNIWPYLCWDVNPSTYPLNSENTGPIGGSDTQTLEPLLGDAFVQRISQFEGCRNTYRFFASPSITIPNTSRNFALSVDVHAFGTSYTSAWSVSLCSGLAESSCFKTVSGEAPVLGQIVGFGSIDSHYKRVIIDLSGYKGQSVYIRLNAGTSSGAMADTAFDNIIIQ